MSSIKSFSNFFVLGRLPQVIYKRILKYLNLQFLNTQSYDPRGLNSGTSLSHTHTLTATPILNWVVAFLLLQQFFGDVYFIVACYFLYCFGLTGPFSFYCTISCDFIIPIFVHIAYRIYHSKDDFFATVRL